MLCINFYAEDKRERAAVKKFCNAIWEVMGSHSGDLKRVYDRLSNEELGIVSRLWETSEHVTAHIHER